jgi:hypothetical protein
MLPEMGARKQAESLDKVNRWCMENEGKEFSDKLGFQGYSFRGDTRRNTMKEKDILQDECRWMRSCGVRNTKEDCEVQHWH